MTAKSNAQPASDNTEDLRTAAEKPAGEAFHSDRLEPLNKNIGFLGYFCDDPAVLNSKNRFAERLAFALARRNIALTILDLAIVNKKIHLPKMSKHENLRQWLNEAPCNRTAQFAAIVRLFLPIIKASFFLRKLKKKHEIPSSYLAELRSNAVFVADFLVAIKTHKLDLLIIWNSALPRHALIKSICRAAGILWLCAEGGIVPGTVEFDDVGNHSESIVIREKKTFSALPISSNAINATKRYLNFIKQNKSSKKYQNETDGELRTVKETLIFCVGMDELSCGVGVKGSPTTKAYSPHFQNEKEFVDYLAKLSQKNKWQVFYKPHPNNQQAFPSYGESVTLVKDANIFDLIDKADVVTTLASSVSFHALLHGKSVVLAGRNALASFEICHELSKQEDLESAIKKALSLDALPSQIQKLEYYSARAIDYQLFAYSEDGEGLGLRDIDCCAEKIAKFANGGDWSFRGILSCE